MSWFNGFLRSAPGSHQGCSVLHPPWLEGHFSHMTSNTTSHSFLHPTCNEAGRAGIPVHLNGGDTQQCLGLRRSGNIGGVNRELRRAGTA